MNPAISRSSVVLPQPEGPSSVVTRPSGTARETPETAATVPNHLPRPTSSTYASRIHDTRDKTGTARNPPSRGHDREGGRQQGRGQRGRRLEPVIADQAEDREGRDLGARRDQEDGELRLVTQLTNVVVQAATHAGSISRRWTSHRTRRREAP